MRLEATIPDSRGQAVLELAKELGISRSQLIDEALTLFLKAVLEVRRGRRLVTLDASASQTACEIATPTLAALEWAMKPASLKVPDEVLTRMHELVADAPAPGANLKAAAKRSRRA